MSPEWFDQVCRSSLGHRSSQEATFDIASLAIRHRISGDFVECGVYAGAQSALMAKALLVNEIDDRRVHLFDTFDGIPKPGPEDAELACNIGGESACSLAHVRSNMQTWGIPESLLAYCVGLIEEVTSADLVWQGLRSIAVLRLDLDLYSGTLAALKLLYPLVSPGGYVIIDDFNLSGCRQAVMEYFKEEPPAPIMWRKPK
jgi:O-methyltransferase